MIAPEMEAQTGGNFGLNLNLAIPGVALTAAIV